MIGVTWSDTSAKHAGKRSSWRSEVFEFHQCRRQPEPQLWHLRSASFSASSAEAAGRASRTWRRRTADGSSPSLTLMSPPRRTRCTLAPSAGYGFRSRSSMTGMIRPARRAGPHRHRGVDPGCKQARVVAGSHSCQLGEMSGVGGGPIRSRAGPVVDLRDGDLAVTGEPCSGSVRP